MIEPDGKLLVGGDGFDGSKLTGMLVRLDANGSLDKSFGSGGSVFSSNGFGALVRRSDGKIVVLGGALARYEPDGTLDKSFGSRGTAPIRGFGEFGVAGALVLQPDGKLVVSGDDGMEFSDSKVNLARYNANGSPDRSFGSGGKVMNDLGRNYALAIQPDGKLVAAGGGGSGSNEWEWVLSRYNANGSLDRSFGAGGVVRTPLKITMGVQALVIQHDGKLVAAGCDANTTKGNSHDVFQLIRYNANGSLDPTFGRGGEVTTAIPANPKPLDEACVSALAIQADGKLVAGGKGQSSLFDTTFALARYLR